MIITYCKFPDHAKTHLRVDHIHCLAISSVCGAEKFTASDFSLGVLNLRKTADQYPQRINSLKNAHC